MTPPRVVPPCFAPLVLLAAARLDAVPVVSTLLAATAWVLIASTLVSIADRATAVRRERGR